MPSKPKERTVIREGDRYLVIEETEAELLKMSRQEAVEGLTERERKFCEYYVHNFNIQSAAIKAGYSSKTSKLIGWRVRQKYNVNRYICWLKAKLSKRLSLKAEDFIDQYARIAFADITDFVTVSQTGRVKVRPVDEMDGQIIRRLKEGPQGVEIELEDRLKALDKLEKYFDVVPKDWKQRIEERKLEIMEERLEMEKADRGMYEYENDGFLDALTQAAVNEVWEDDVDDGYDDQIDDEVALTVD